MLFLDLTASSRLGTDASSRKSSRMTLEGRGLGPPISASGPHPARGLAAVYLRALPSRAAVRAGPFGGPHGDQEARRRGVRAHWAESGGHGPGQGPLPPSSTALPSVPSQGEPGVGPPVRGEQGGGLPPAPYPHSSCTLRPPEAQDQDHPRPPRTTRAVPPPPSRAPGQAHGPTENPAWGPALVWGHFAPRP